MYIFSIAEKVRHGQGGLSKQALHLWLQTPPLSHPYPTLHLRANWKFRRQQRVERTLRKTQPWVVRKVGLQANDPGPGLGRRKYHFLACLLWGLLRPASGYSSALRDTASPWKAEVVLPLQRASLRQASPFPSPLWGLTFTGRVGAPRRTNTNMTSLLQWEVEWTHTHLPSLTVPAPKGRPKDRPKTSPPDVLPTETGRRGLERSFQPVWSGVNKEEWVRFQMLTERCGQASNT